MSCSRGCYSNNRCCCGCCCCRLLKPLCPDRNTSLCNILALLSLWTLFDLFCCHYLCDCLCRFFSFLLLLTIVVKTILYIIRTILTFIQLITDFYYFKFNVECKIANLESSLQCIEVGEYSVTMCPKCRQDSCCADRPPQVFVELGRQRKCCSSRCDASSTPRSDRRSVTK